LIVYLHGLNSAGDGSFKATRLREALAPVEIVSPTYPAYSAERAVATLEAALTEPLERAHARSQPRLLVGSSMGGFYGAWLGARLGFQHLVMINPALRPWELLRAVEGWQYNQALDERYYLSAEMVAATRDYATEPAHIGLPVTLLLDRDDEFIDVHQALEAYSGIAGIHLFEGGSHGFEHMDEALEIIGALYRALPRGSHPV